MALISIICPKCGGKTQVEAGRSVMCPYCACELNVQQGDQGFAFVQDMQFAQSMQPAQDVQFAEPQVQFQQPVMQQPDVFAVPQTDPAQFAAPPQYRQYPQETLQTARKRRGQWHFLNLAMIAIQAVILFFALSVIDFFYEDDIAVLMILAWLLSQPVCAILSGVTRPDDAYIEQKPLFKSKLVQSIVHFMLSLPASAAAGGILFVILRIIADIF